MCISPVTVKRDYRRLEPEVSQGYNTMTDTVPCGRCPECLASRRNSWAFRLWKQMDVSESCVFLTLTYENEPLSPNGHGTLRKKDVQDFLKRLRKRSEILTDVKIKYYCCGEYGGRYKRPHYHLIAYNIPQALMADNQYFAENIWKHGQVHIARANMSTIFYTVGYVMKGTWRPEPDETCPITMDGEILFDDRVPEYSTMSKNLGLCYLTEEIWNWHLEGMRSFVTAQNGSLMSMPRYYRDKVFSREERKELAQEARLLRDYDFLSWDFTKECIDRNEVIRKHKKEQLLKRMKL